MDIKEKLASQIGDDVRHIFDREALFKEALARIEELERDLKSVLDRESATTARYDARIEELERERDHLAAQLKEAVEALADGADAVTHALCLLPRDANQRKGMEAALDRMSAALARMKEGT